MYGDAREFQASLYSLHAQEEKENLEHVSATVREADKYSYESPDVVSRCSKMCHKCMLCFCLLSCKTLNLKSGIILMLYSETTSWVLVSVNVCKAEEKERRLASTIESMQASHTLKNITLEVKILTK